MIDHPILFSGEMVKAILEGRKTQTRRVITCRMEVDGDESGFGLKPTKPCPYGLPGDRLWVREAFQIVEPHGSVGDEWIGDDIIEVDGPLSHGKPESIGTWWSIVYRADGDLGVWYRPSIHMPRWASRITLEVTDVRVERVQDISNDDARSEGVAAWHDSVWTDGPYYRGEFQILWDKINEKRGYPWRNNPWVWVISFRVR